jgi:molybdopterin/thiamine biosynthesis adenylyltransferase
LLGGDQTPFLSPIELQRYGRQMILAGWGRESQEKIKRAAVFIAGAGGLGSPVSIYLAAAGVGRIRICDAGAVETSNLNRQILHSDGDVGRRKIESAVRTLRSVNPHVEIEGLDARIGRESVANLVSGSDILVDCLDNFETRYFLNEHAVKTGLPLVHAGVWGMAGQLTFIKAPETPCLNCLFPEAPPQETFPVVGAAPGVIGCLEAIEVLKYITGRAGLLKGRLVIWEGDLMRFQELAVEKDPGCPVCGENARKNGSR